MQSLEEKLVQVVAERVAGPIAAVFLESERRIQAFLELERTKLLEGIALQKQSLQELVSQAIQSELAQLSRPPAENLDNSGTRCPSEDAETSGTSREGSSDDVGDAPNGPAAPTNDEVETPVPNVVAAPDVVEEEGDPPPPTPSSDIFENDEAGTVFPTLGALQGKWLHSWASVGSVLVVGKEVRFQHGVVWELEETSAGVLSLRGWHIAQMQVLEEVPELVVWKHPQYGSCCWQRIGEEPFAAASPGSLKRELPAEEEEATSVKRQRTDAASSEAAEAAEPLAPGAPEDAADDFEGSVRAQQDDAEGAPAEPEADTLMPLLAGAQVVEAADASGPPEEAAAEHEAANAAEPVTPGPQEEATAKQEAAEQDDAQGALADTAADTLEPETTLSASSLAPAQDRTTMRSPSPDLDDLMGVPSR